jgi:hypothetical protein
MFQEPHIEIEHGKRDEAEIVRIKEILAHAMHDSGDIETLYNKVRKFAHHLQATYPDYARYELYHVLVGSTPRPEDKNGKDFPGDDSVEEFIKNL